MRRYESKCLYFVALSCLSLVACVVGGCQRDLGDPLPPWQTLDALVGENGMRPVNSAVKNDDWYSVKVNASGPVFQKTVDEFASSPIPPGYTHKAADKEKAVAALRALIKAAGENSVPNLQKAWDDVNVRMFYLEKL